MQMRQKYIIVVNKLVKYIEDNGGDLSNIFCKQVIGWDGIWYLEGISKVNGKFKSADIDGVCVYNDYIIEMFQRIFVFKVIFKRVQSLFYQKS